MNRLASCLLALAFGLASPAVVSQATTVTVAAKEELPFFGRNRPRQGLSAEIVRTALQRAGYAPSFVFKSWADTVEGADIGVYDIIGSMWQTEERARTFTFSEPYLYHEIVFIKRKSDPDITFETLDDLDGRIIGTVKGYAYREDFLRSPKFIRVEQNHLLQNLNALAQGELDMTLGESRKIRFVLSEYMKENAKTLELLPTPLVRRGARIAVSRSHPQHRTIIDRFNHALAQMKADGTYDRIVAGHGY